MDADFAHLGAEHEAFDADEVAQVEQTFEHGVVHFLVLFGTNVIAGDIYLDASFGILEFSFYIGRESIGYILCCGIGLDAHRAKFIHAVATNDFLFT